MRALIIALLVAASFGLLLAWQTDDMERTRWLWRIWVEQARQSMTTMSEQARIERAAYDERLFWQRGEAFQHRLNDYLVERSRGVEDLRKARTVQKAWRSWQKCRPWPKPDEK
jgi:hypothetical protein